MISRRKFITCAGLAGAGVLSGGFLASCFNNSQPQKVNYTNEEALALHKKLITIDSHCDTPLHLLRKDFDIGIKNNPHDDGVKIDFPRMIEGGLDASFFAVFLGQGPRTTEGFYKAKEQAILLFDSIHQAVSRYSNIAQIARKSSDAKTISEQNKLAIYIGLENGYPIGLDIKMIEHFYTLGARYITLCHTKNNDICDSSTDANGEEHNGLSPFGINVVKEMNRLGIMIDVSHVSDKSFYNCIEHSAAPVIASHSCARALCNNPRNLSDEMLKALAQNNGVVQMCILSDYVKTPTINNAKDAALDSLRKTYKDFNELSEAEQNVVRKEWFAIMERYSDNLATVSDAVDHIEHIINVAGIDHVGIGTDFDGGGGLKDCYDVSQLGNITVELLKRGYSEADLEKIWSGNFLRVFNTVEKIALKS